MEFAAVRRILFFRANIYYQYVDLAHPIQLFYKAIIPMFCCFHSTQQRTSELNSPQVYMPFIYSPLVLPEAASARTELRNPTKASASFASEGVTVATILDDDVVCGSLSPRLVWLAVSDTLRLA